MHNPSTTRDYYNHFSEDGLKYGNDCELSPVDEKLKKDNDNKDEMEHYVQMPLFSKEGDTYYVNQVPFKDFRSRLIRHFNICYSKEQLQWPTCNM